INSDPCYAFLLDTNSLIQNKLIIAHVLAHCDFFKNNVRFSNTRRDMVESMTATAERVAYYEHHYGKDEVENFLDAVLSIQEHIDPSIMRPRLTYNYQDDTPIPVKHDSPYIDLWSIDKD
ncbi:SpoVR family protein, partial [Pantoea sp. SIMBA_133]